MIRLGICTSIDNASIMAEIGYDYIELGMTAVTRMSDEEYADLLAKVKASPLPVEAMNGMIPADYVLCSEEGTGEAVKEYLTKAFARAHELGVKVVVFGSGGARRLPDGMRHADAYNYLSAYLELASDIAEPYGISIAIEPLRAAECNIINHVAEAQWLAKKVMRSNVGALADLYHMMAGNEDSSAVGMKRQGSVIHCHIADRANRAYPAANDGSQKDYAEFFAQLKKVNYAGRVSIEGSCKDFEADAKAAFAELNQYR